jgi:Transcriptional regulatory protein, C terminal
LENPSNSQFGPFFLDVRERVLLRDGQPVPVTPKAFDLLAALVEQPGRLISKEELLQKVWPDSQSVAFDAGGELKRIDVRGGAPRTVCALPNGDRRLVECG